MATTDTGRRAGAETRAEILRVALRLFIENGYEGTSTRDITDALGITKSTLYHHFQSKEQLVTSLVQQRRTELEAFAEWVEAQPPGPDLLGRAALRWVDGTTPDRLDLMRLAHANQPMMRRTVAGGADVRSGFERVIGLFTDDSTPIADRLRIRMAFDTVSAVLLAAQGTGAGPEDILAAARSATIALTDDLLDRTAG